MTAGDHAGVGGPEQAPHAVTSVQDLNRSTLQRAGKTFQAEGAAGAHTPGRTAAPRQRQRSGHSSSASRASPAPGGAQAWAPRTAGGAGQACRPRGPGRAGATSPPRQPVPRERGGEGGG